VKRKWRLYTLVRFEINCKGFWGKCIAFERIGFLDFVHRQIFPQKHNTVFCKLYLYPYSGKKEVAPTLLGPLETASLNHWALSKGPNRVGSTSFYLETETDTVSETLCFLRFQVLTAACVQSPVSTPTFKRCVLFSSSEPWWWRHYAPLNHRHTPTSIHGSTF
jgi:hypothetical protein